MDFCVDGEFDNHSQGHTTTLHIIGVGGTMSVNNPLK